MLNPFSKITVFFTSLVALSMVSCSVVKEGKIVQKGMTENGSPNKPFPSYWADVRGKNWQNKEVTARLEFFEVDWKKLRKGQRIVPAQYGIPTYVKQLVNAHGKKRKDGGVAVMNGAMANAKPKASNRAAVAKNVPAKDLHVEASADPGESATELPPAVATGPASAAQRSAEREARLRQVRDKAVEDDAVRALKKNIHNARSDEEQGHAWKQYNSALRDKMRAIDPSLSDLIDTSGAAPGAH